MLKKSSVLWILSVILTLIFVIYQRKTGPTYPVKGEMQIAGSFIKYRFIRSQNIGIDVPIIIQASDPKTSGFFIHKRFKSNDNWSEKIPLIREGENIKGMMPALNELAGKREYLVYINDQPITETPIIIRFKGNVPAYILIPHILFMFAAMLVSTRTGFEALFRNISTYKLTLFTTICLFLGGMILGPIVQKFAFDAYWTGWPWGFDLTDNKTLIAMIMWTIALWKVRKNPENKGWVIAAFLILTIVYLVPHSVLGSEFNYSGLD